MQLSALKKELKSSKKKHKDITAKQDKKREVRVYNLIKMARSQRKRPNQKKIKQAEETLTVTEIYWQEKIDELEGEIKGTAAKYGIIKEMSNIKADEYKLHYWGLSLKSFDSSSIKLSDIILMYF